MKSKTMLIDILKEIKTKNKFYSNAWNGDQFESKFRNKLKSSGFSEIVQNIGTTSAIQEISFLENIDFSQAKRIFIQIKKRILEKNSEENVKNPFSNIKNSFIFQPYGSQNFPDFIVILEKYIIPIEIKYSKNPNGKINYHATRPMWNSNIPKPNAIYIYGIAGKAVTYFKGSDILSYELRKTLLDYFKDLDKKQRELDSKIKNFENNFGIYPYLRKAYDHKKAKSTFLNKNNEKTVESYFSKNSNDRENNVIMFLEDIEKDN